VLVGAGQSSWVDTGTSGTVDPLTATETKRALPVLPGRIASFGTENTAEFVAQGFLAADVILEAQ
jgi:hypothetical protein